MLRRLLILAFVLVSVEAAVFKLKMDRLEGKGTKIMKEGKPHEIRAYRELSRKQYKEHLLQNRHNTRAGRLASSSQPLYDYADQIYVVNASVGTPPQQFRLLIDTYAGDTWVPDSTCSDDLCGCVDENPYCEAKRTFDSSKSKTYVANGRTFQDSNTGGTGFFGQDTFGLTADLQIPKVTFGQVDTPFQYFTRYPFDGFIGLTYRSSDGVKSVIQEAVDQGLLDAPIFTINYGSDGIDSKGERGGTITYGGVDTADCAADFNYVPVLSQQYWEFNVDSVQIAGKKRTGPFVTITEASNAVIYLPQAALQDVIDVTKATYNSNYNIYQVDCDVTFQWSLVANGKTYVIDEKYAVVPYQDQCFLAFEPLDFPDFDILLGSPFVRDYCLVYDTTGNLGFSKANSN